MVLGTSMLEESPSKHSMNGNCIGGVVSVGHGGDGSR